MASISDSNFQNLIRIANILFTLRDITSFTKYFQQNLYLLKYNNPENSNDKNNLNISKS